MSAGHAPRGAEPTPRRKVELEVRAAGIGDRRLPRARIVTLRAFMTGRASTGAPKAAEHVAPNASSTRSSNPKAPTFATSQPPGRRRSARRTGTPRSTGAGNLDRVGVHVEHDQVEGTLGRPQPGPCVQPREHLDPRRIRGQLRSARAPSARPRDRARSRPWRGRTPRAGHLPKTRQVVRAPQPEHQHPPRTRAGIEPVREPGGSAKSS